jgi:phage protein D
MGRERVPTVEVIWQKRDASAAVLAVEVEDDDRLADKAEVVYESRTACASFREGQELTIKLGWDGEAAVLFHGVIVQLKGEAGEDGRERARVTALDLSTRLHRAAKTAQFEGGKLSEIIQTIVAAYGLELGTITCEPDTVFTPQTPLRQTNLTDLAFLQELARRYGARAFLEVIDNVPKFYFVPERVLMAAPLAGRMKYCGGTSELISFEYRRSASEAPASVTATAVDQGSAAAEPVAPDPLPASEPITVDDSLLAALAKRDPNEKASYEAAVEAAGEATEQPEAQVRSEATVGMPSDPERARLAARRDLTRLRGMTGEGVAVGTVHLRAKSRVELFGLAPWAEGAWYVRRAKHVFHVDGTTAAGGRAATYMTTFVATRRASSTASTAEKSSTTGTTSRPACCG